MHRNVCFIELTKDENGFINATQSIETACIRNYLKEKGINSMIYMDKSLPSINDMAEDILSLSEDALVFVLHHECEDVTKVVISYLMELEDIEIYVMHNKSVFTDEKIILLGDHPEDELVLALGGDVETPVDMFNLSPYTTGVLLTRDVDKYGIWLGRSQKRSRKTTAIQEDIDKVIETYSGVSDLEDIYIQLHGIYIEDLSYFTQIIELISKVELPFIKFDIPVSDKLFKEVTKYGESNISCTFNLCFKENVEEKYCNHLKALIKNTKVSQINFPAKLLLKKSMFNEIVLSSQKSKLIKIYPMGEVDSEEIISDYKPIILENARSMYLPFYRGLLKSKTGLYSGVKLDGYVHHVEIPGSSLGKLSKEFMNEVVGLNSSIHVRDLKVDIDSSRYSFHENGVVNTRDHNYSNYVQGAVEDSRSPSNLLSVSKTDKIHVNSLAYSSDCIINQLNYSDAKKNIESIKAKRKDHENNVFLFGINSQEDFNAFLKDAEYYKETHQLCDLPLAYGYLENSCRYVNASECNVDKIPRVKLNTNDEIFTCDLATDPTAKLGATLFEISQNCFAKREKEFHERGCYKCPVNSWCSRCTQMPDFMNETFCSIMKESAYVLDYALIPIVFLGLLNTNPIYRDLDPKEVKMTNEYMFNIVDSNIKGNVAPYLPKFTSMVLCRDKYLVWTPMKNKYFNVSVEFASVIELLLKRVKADQIPDLLSKTLDIELAESTEITKVVCDTLKKTGLLYREIE